MFELAKQNLQVRLFRVFFSFWVLIGWRVFGLRSWDRDEPKVRPRCHSRCAWWNGRL